MSSFFHILPKFHRSSVGLWNESTAQPMLPEDSLLRLSLSTGDGLIGMTLVEHDRPAVTSRPGFQVQEEKLYGNWRWKKTNNLRIVKVFCFWLRQMGWVVFWVSSLVVELHGNATLVRLFFFSQVAFCCQKERLFGVDINNIPYNNIFLCQAAHIHWNSTMESIYIYIK